MSSLKNNRILITGGAGFIGSWTAEKLLNQGPSEIIILDNFVRGTKDNLKSFYPNKKVTLIKGDITDKKLLSKVFKKVDLCIHLAALRITQCSNDPNQAFKVLFQGTFNILDAAVKNKLKKVVVASSASIYGMSDVFPTKESHHPYNNRTFYGAGKLANEQMLRAYNEMYGLNYCALRYFNVYGPRMDTYGKYTEVLIRWYKAILNGEKPVIYGPGKQTMDFIYVEDVAQANILALKSKISDRVFNIGTGVETSLNTLCKLLIKNMGVKLTPEHIKIPKSRKKVEVTRRCADISNAVKYLKFKPKTNLDQGLYKLVSWLRENAK